MLRSCLASGAWFIGLASLLLYGTASPPPLMSQDLRESALVERLRATARGLLDEDGKLAVRVEDTKRDEEVAIVGVVRISVPMDQAMAGVRRIERLFARSPFVSQVGAIDDALAPGELERLRLSEDQARLLSKCKVGSCKFKLPRRALLELRGASWPGPEGMRARADDLLSDFLADCLADYMARGNHGLPVYHDKRVPLAAADGYEDLLRGASSLFEHDDPLHRHVRAGPEPPPGSTSHFFWMVEDYGLRPVITVNQAIVRGDEGPRPEWGRVVIKQIYGSHYLQAALRTIEVVSVPGTDGRELWVALHGRFRFDKEIGGLSRGILEHRLESVWADQLRAIYAYLVSTQEAGMAMKETG